MRERTMAEVGDGVRVARAARTLRLNDGATHDLRLRMARERVESLLRRAILLAPEDQWLLEQVLGRGRSLASIARLSGGSPEALRKRTKRLIARVESAMYGFVLERAELWDSQMRDAARSCVGRGLSMRATARALRLPMHTVRTRMLEVHAMFVASVERATPAPVSLLARGMEDAA